MKNFSRATVGSLLTLSLVFVTSCGEPPKADPKDILSGAQNNLAQFVEKDMASQMHINENGENKGTFDVVFNSDAESLKSKFNGEFGLTQAANKSGTGSTINSQVALKINGDVDSMMGKGTATVDAEVRSFAEKVFFMVNEAKFSTTEASIQEYYDSQYKAKIEKVIKKWFFAPSAMLTGGKDAGSIDTAKFALIAKAMKDQMFFTVVKELPSENSMYVYDVKPNKDGIVAFVKNTATALDLPYSAKEEKDLTDLISQLSADGVSHKLYVSKDKEYSKLVTTSSIKTGEKTVEVESKIESPVKGDLNVHVTFNTPAGDKKDTVVFDVTKTGTMYSIQAQGTGTAPKMDFSVNLKGNFQKKDVVIEVPTDAQSIEELAKAIQ